MNAFSLFFVIFAFVFQVLLLADFIIRLFRPGVEIKYGWMLYAFLATAGFLAGTVFLLTRQTWYFSLAFGVLFAWALLGLVVDKLHPVEWRKPVFWPIFLPYVLLFIASLFAFWIPLWYVGMPYWIAYTILYAVHTILNISSHFIKPKEVA